MVMGKQSAMRLSCLLAVGAVFLLCGWCPGDMAMAQGPGKASPEVQAGKTGPVPGIVLKPAALPAESEDAARHKHHEPFMRQCYDLALSAAKKGNHPFGALLVYEGKVIMTAENSVRTDNDQTRHAELNLMVKARRQLPVRVIAESTLYTSTAPCMMCATALWYRGVKKVVFGVSYEGFNQLTGLPEDGSIALNRLYRYTGREIEWTGPVLEAEGQNVLRQWPLTDPFHTFFRKK